MKNRTVRIYNFFPRLKWEKISTPAVFSFLALALSVLLSCNGNKNLPKLIKGTMDLRNTAVWNIKTDGALYLRGEWEFYWNHFLEPSNFPNQIMPIFFDSPSVWNGNTVNGSKIGGYGFATYRARILLPDSEHRKLALKIQDQAHSWKLYINGKFIKEWGKTGTGPETSVPVLKTDTVVFESDSESVEIIFHVSNFHHRVGGLRYEILFGPEDRIFYEKQRVLITESYLFGGFLMIAVYHFAIFYFRRRNLAPLFFGLFCLSVMMYTSSTGERVIYNVFPDLFSWETSYRLEFAWISCMSTFFILFFISLYPQKKNSFLSAVSWISIAVNTGYTLMLAFTEPKFFTEYLLVLDLSRILIGSTIIYYLIIYIRHGKEGSLILLSGFLILFLCSINDTLAARSILHTPRMTKGGLAVMLFMQAIMLAKIFTKDYKMAISLSESLSLTNQAYSRFVPSEFLNLLDKKSILDIQLGDQVQKEMTVLFSDIRSFTSLSEKLSPKENFQFLNAYLRRIVPHIKNHNGFIDKYIGDAMMGLFPGNADDALQASISIQKEIADYNRHREQSGFPRIKVGIGLHTGNLILGTIGHRERMEGTVISDAVNLASRIEGLTKHYGSGILISENTFDALEEPLNYQFRLLDNVRVKGKTDSVFVIEILDGLSDDLIAKFLDTKKEFETANLLYKQKAFEASISLFRKVLEANPNDTAAAFYLKRAEYYLKYGTPPEWENGEVFAEK